jgi:branched-chain amino acid transport system permease protein
VAAQAQALRKGFDIAHIVKEAGIAGFITVALTIGLVGFETVDAGGYLSYNTRYGAVAWAAAIVLLGRAGLAFIRAGQPLPALIGSLAAGAVWSVVLLTVEPGSPFAWLKPFAAPIVNWVAVAAAGIVALRAALALRRARAEAAAAADREQVMDRVGATVQHVARWLGPALAVFALTMPFLPWFGNLRAIGIATLILTTVMLGWGLNIVVGLAGLLDLGYVAFYAVGAYSYGLLAHYFGASFWVCLPFAGLMAATFGVLLGFPVLRLRGDYLAIVTLGFGEMIRIILLNWWWFTGGPNGVKSIPRPSFFGLPFEANPPAGTESFHTFFGLEFSPLHRNIFLYYLILILALITNAVTLRIRRLPLGRAWEALREDEIACRALGINPTSTKLTAFAMGAMFGGFAGSFFATRQGFISPDGFTFIISATILGIVVLGGMGSQLGVVLASVVFIGLTEFSRELAAYRMLMFGAALVAIMIWRPRGLLAHREPTIRLNSRPRVRGPT